MRAYYRADHRRIDDDPHDLDARFFFVTLLSLPVRAAAPDVRDPHIRWSAKNTSLSSGLA